MNIGIIGLGLIGASYAKAFQKDGRYDVYGTDILKGNVDSALQMGVIKGVLDDEHLSTCNLVITALYPADTIEYIKSHASLFAKNTIVIDSCGIKEPICSALNPIAKEYGFTFIGCDPFVGKTESGYEASSATLFDGQTVILTPDESVGQDKINLLSNILHAAGFANNMIKTPAQHDEIIAHTSQLAHIISNALVKSPQTDENNIFSGSFKDLTKCSNMDDRMWSEVFIGNKKYLINEIEAFVTSLKEYKDLIETGNSGDLRETIRAGSNKTHPIAPDNVVTVSASHSYKVIVDKGILGNMGDYVKSVANPSTVVIVVDDIVRDLYADILIQSIEAKGIRVLTYVIPHGEQSKNEQQLFGLLEFMVKNDVTRSDLLIALGGGVIGDLTGFASAIFLRGIPHIQVPTSLLAAVDSSVGGKTAIDLPVGKNLVGAFNQPRMVVCDTDVLKSLPDDEFSAGMGEVIKYGVLCDPELFSYLETSDIRENIQEVILRCVTIKRNVVMADEYDTGARQTLNLGHTLAHSIETCSNFGIKHGHAVAIGMIAVAKCAYIAGLADENSAPRIEALCKRCGIPLQCDSTPEELVEEISKDKKRTGSKITLVIPKRIGETYLQKMDLAKAEQFFTHMNDTI